MEDHRPMASRDQVAAYLQVSKAALARWAQEGVGPKYVIVGNRARYHWSDVQRWLEEQRIGGEVA